VKHLRYTAWAGVLACLGFVLICSSGCKKKAPEAPLARGLQAGGDEIVARVGDYEITGKELARTAHSYAQKLMMQGRRPPPGYEDSILDVMIKSELLYQSGKDLGIPDLSQKVETMYKEMVGQFPSEQAFAEALGQEGMTPQELRERIKKDVVVNEVLEKKVYQGIAVTDDEVAAFYRDNPASFERPEMIRARHILIGFAPAATEEQKKASREKMDKVKERLAKEDFAAVAKDVSEDPGSAPQGGDLGFFPQGQMDPIFEKAAWSLATGQTSDLVETRFGYHLIQLEERRPAGIVPLEEAKEKLAEALKGRKASEKVEEYCQKVRLEVPVQKLRAPAEIPPAGLPALPVPSASPVPDAVPVSPEAEAAPSFSPPPPPPPSSAVSPGQS